MTELAVALAVGLILMAVALPAFLRAYSSYQLTSAATQVSDILRLGRYEAIRLNKPINCVFQPSPTDPNTMQGSLTDSLGNPLTGISSKVILLGTAGSLVDPGSVPGAAALPATAALGATVPVGMASTGGSVQFDARGAVTSGNVNVFYLNSPGDVNSGYRAVLLMPAGSIQIWTGDSSGTGNWDQLR